MNCQTSKEHISQFLDNELSRELLPPLFQHLGDCEECRNFFVQTKSIHDSVKKLEYVPAPDMLDQKFAVLGMGEEKKPFLSRKFSISVSSAVLSLGVIIVMTLYIYALGSFQEKNILSQYEQTMNLFQQSTTTSIDRN